MKQETLVSLKRELRKLYVTYKAFESYLNRDGETFPIAVAISVTLQNMSFDNEEYKHVQEGLELLKAFNDYSQCYITNLAYKEAYMLVTGYEMSEGFEEEEDWFDPQPERGVI
jgi:hypothetical protein